MAKRKIYPPVLVGQKYGRWTVQAQSVNRKSERMWQCMCECGNTGTVIEYALKVGGSLSCGCLRKERSTMHGDASGKPTAEYHAWKAMKHRCLNPNNTHFPRYGGRGITLCDEWLDFRVFLHDMGRRPTSGHSLDRIDNEKGYSPDNCKWSTRDAQMHNRSNTQVVTYKGERVLLNILTRSLGVSRNMVGERLRRGWNIEDAVSTPKLR